LLIATDCINQQVYEGRDKLTLTSVLVEVIKKICQSKKRDYLSKMPEGYRIIDDYDEDAMLSNIPAIP
jgi:hypothetical protein